MNNPKVSVIIPVYNVEKFIERCTRSLFEQTLDDLEYIFIDDCGKDNSMTILRQTLDKYPNRNSQVRILKNENNMGVSYSRQRGIDNATGEYIIHCDPDDWVELDMYETLFEVAKKKRADIVICDFIEENNTVSKLIPQLIPQKEICLKSIVSGNFHMALWNKLINRTFIIETGIKFNEKISLWEDMSFMVPLIFSTNSIAKIDRALYHYDISIPHSIVKSISMSSIKSMVLAVENISNELIKRNLLDIDNLDLMALKLRAKSAYLLKGNTYSPKMWRDSFSDIRWTFLKHPYISLKRKFIYTLTTLKLDFIVKLLIDINIRLDLSHK